MLTASRLRDVLAFDKKTGIFRWKIRLSNRVRIDSVAGYGRADGFRKIAIDGRFYLGHVLAVLHQTGKWPAKKRRNLRAA